MKLLCFALCVLLVVPGLVLAADDGAGPSRPSPPLSWSERIDRFLERIAECQQKLKKAKAEKARTLAVTSNPATVTAAYEEAEKAFQSADHSFRLHSQSLDIAMGDYQRLKNQELRERGVETSLTVEHERRNDKIETNEHSN